MKPTQDQINHALSVLDSAVKYDPSTLAAARAICARAMQDDGGDELAFVSTAGQNVSRRVATNLFNMVADKSNWKNPIDATVVIYDATTLSNLLRAITFFTGSNAACVKVGTNQFRVVARGYYMDIGA